MSNSIDTDAFAAQLKSDGNTLKGEPTTHVNGSEIWWESSEGDEYDILGFGVWRVHETVVGKEGPLESHHGGNIWTNHIILQQGEVYLQLLGEYDSWDAQGWDGTVKQVTMKPRVVFDWEEIR